MRADSDADEIERIAHVGSWTLDPATGQAAWSAEMYRILGLDTQGAAVALPDISRLFTAESVERVGAAVARAAATGEPWHEDLELTRPGGGWVISNGVAERDAAGNVVRIRGTMQDVTERRRLEAQLGQSQRLEAVGQLAGGIAHDFNNILTAIRGYADLARGELSFGHPAIDDIEHVIAAADRATDLVRQLLAFSRRQILVPRVLDPAAEIDGLVPLLRRLLGEGVELTTIHARDLDRIRIDPGQLGQVIVNLAVNARDAMPTGGRLTIETMNVDLDDTYAADHADATAGRHVLIAVSDTGHGMDADTRERAFDPFFTTRASAGGTGMGLATVYGIVHQSGGSIYVYSEPGAGTTLKSYFPVTDAAVEPLIADAPVPSRLTGTETILLVEDDEAIREFARRVLGSAGFEILSAGDGTTAIDLANAYADRIHLLLTDVVLPGIHGVEIAARLRVKRPDMQVVFASGFTENTVIHHGVAAPGVNFLAKPYRPEDLLRIVREVLDTDR